MTTREKQEKFLDKLENWEMTGKHYDLFWSCKTCKTSGTQRTVGVMRTILHKHADCKGFYFNTRRA